MKLSWRLLPKAEEGVYEWTNLSVLQCMVIFAEDIWHFQGGQVLELAQDGKILHCPMISSCIP